MTLGGSEQLVRTLIRNIDRDRFSPSLAWFHGDALDEFTSLNIPLYHVPKQKSFDISTMKAMAKIIAENDIQVVNAHHFMSMVYCFYGCKKNHAKLIYTEHSAWEIEKIKLKWQLAGKILLQFVDKIVGVSPDVSNCLTRRLGAPPSRTDTVKNGVNLDLFSGKHPSLTLKNELGINAEDKVIGIVANLKKVKNHLFLLKAFKEVSAEYDKVKLIVIGQSFADDPESSEEEIKNYIATHDLTNKVFMLGYRSDIPQLLSIMDIFCLTSHMEGLPISIIEAMASGLAIIGTDAPGIREVVKHSHTGLIVPINNVTALKTAILTLVKDEALRSLMGKNSRSEAEKFSLTQCVRTYENLFLVPPAKA